MAANSKKQVVGAANATKALDEEDSVVFVYDRRKGNEPERKIDIGGVFNFPTFKERIRQEFNISNNIHFVIATTNREEIKDNGGYEELIDSGDTLYILNHINQNLPAPAKERVEFLPHYDTLVKSGMYEYYASAGQNPLPFAFAELIDNSLTATCDNLGPRTIELRLFLDESGDKSMICIIDNGKGMTSRQLNNWAIYRLSKFIRKERRPKQTDDDDNRSNSPANEAVPRSLTSDISYFGVGGKQAIFFIGQGTRMITKPKDSRDVHELTISKEEFERREKNRESIYSGFISNRPVGDARHLGSDDQNLKNLIKEEIGKESFTHVIITGINSHHIHYLKHDFVGWCRQLAHIYHYYIHGPRGNEASGLGNKRPISPFKNIDITVEIHERGKTPRVISLRDIKDDMQTKYIRSAIDSFEFRAVVEGTGIVEGILRYHPFLYDKETFPAVDSIPGVDGDVIEEEDYYNEDRPARGNRPIFECYWSGRLIPYTCVENFDWCSAPKKRGPIPVECYNRISGVLWTNDKFEVSTNKLTFIDLEVRLKDKNTIFQKIVLGQAQRVKIDRQFHEWLRECHETYDKQVKFCSFEGAIARPEIAVKRQQSPWAVYKAIEWDGKIFKRGQLVRTFRTVPIITGTIKRFLLYGHHEGDVFATGGEMEIAQEPKLLYDEVKVVPLSKLDRSANDRILKRFIEEEEGKLPEKLIVTWPEGNQVKQGDRMAAGSTVGAIQVDIKNRKGESISRLPGSHLAAKKLLVELKVILHTPNGEEELVSHLSQYVKAWSYWFKRMENMKNLGDHTIKIQVVLNESGVTAFGGRPLPNHKIKFSITEAPPSKFSVGLLDPPFRVGVPFNIPLELQDEFNHSTKPVPNMKPVLEASGLELSYAGVQARGTTLLVKDVTAIGDVGSFQGKNFNFKVTLPGLAFPTQTLKIRLSPGQPHSLHVPTFVEEISIENGQALNVTIEVRDKAGNITVHPKLDVTCKFLGAPGLPTYCGDCSTGKTTLTGNIIFFKNLKKGQKITAKVWLPNFSDISPIEKVIQVLPNSNPHYIDMWYTENSGSTKLRHQQELRWPAGDHIKGILFALFDEGFRQIKISPEIASKVKVSWMPRLSHEKVQQGILPDIKVPASAAEAKYVQLSLSDGSGLEFGFTIRPEPGEVSQIKCVCQGSKKVRLGEVLDGDIIVNVTDSHGNPIKKVPHGALSHLEVTGEGLKTKQLQKFIIPNTGFALRQVRFEGGPLGQRELCVKYHDFTEYVKLQMLAGPPTKLSFIDTSLYEPVSVFSGSRIDKNLTVQLCDENDNPTSDTNARMTLTGSSGLDNVNLQMKADKDGRAGFGRPIISAATGHHKLTIKAIVGRNVLVSTVDIYIQPDPNKPTAVFVEFEKIPSLIVGDFFPAFDVRVEAEDGSVFLKLPPKNVLMRLWKVDTSSQTKPSPEAVSYVPDNRQQDDKPGHFYFRKRKAPEVAGHYNMFFQVMIGHQDTIISETLSFVVHPGPPVKLVPDSHQPMVTVSNTQKSLSRSLVRTLKLQLKDQYGNATGSNVSGKVVVSLCGDGGNELPMLVGNKSSAEFSMTKGVVTVQNLVLQESTPGKDGGEYSLKVEVQSPQLKPTNVDPYVQPFLFYNDARKQYRMSQLTKERDTLLQTINVFQGFFQTTDKLIAEMKMSVQEAQHNENQIKSELRKLLIQTSQVNTVETIQRLLSEAQRQRETMLQLPRRKCELSMYVDMNSNPAILGKIGQLAEVVDDTIAHVLSWHMLTDMDCLVVRTSEAAMKVYQATQGRQQVLPLDSIFRKSIPNWNRELPHTRFLRTYQPPGNPVFARHLLQFPAHEESCRLVFGQLLGDVIILDTLEDATAYRREIVNVTPCPTLLTRDGNRVKSNGKFGGTHNQFLPLEKMKGVIFGAPIPEACHQLSKQIELLESLLQATQKRLEVEQELTVQEEEQKSASMRNKRRECQEAVEQLALVEKKLGMNQSSAEGDVGPERSGRLTPQQQQQGKRVRSSSRSPVSSVTEESSPSTRSRRTPVSGSTGSTKRRR
ncbi:structural maintenance of chromosomes flexible hinge domain-containing protein 1-like [Acanthaster planci]|uniref:Structural maintenance of chromosomes flexible hinge domain-containing protein 1-like n=1 Tax=Acanthaster planci TaxID=133434 RepID=A0A8B7Y8R7_ACAPL|nr:structural maintenance of chromosomes flexible hinge domain-containing protein 1-like [Acanthaster planci]